MFKKDKHTYEENLKEKYVLKEKREKQNIYLTDKNEKDHVKTFLSIHVVCKQYHESKGEKYHKTFFLLCGYKNILAISC